MVVGRDEVLPFDLSFTFSSSTWLAIRERSYRRFGLAGKLIECQTLANDARYGHAKTLTIGHFAIIESKRLLI